MTEFKTLKPQEAAKFVLDDIKNDPTKLEAFGRVFRAGPDGHKGKRVIEEVYGLPKGLVGEEFEWELGHKL